MKLLSVVLVIFCVTLIFAQTNKPYKSEVWVADQGDGSYKNPIIHADYSNRDVARAGDDCYRAASSFNIAPNINGLF